MSAEATSPGSAETGGEIQPDQSRPITSINAGPSAKSPWKYWALVSFAVFAVGAGTLYGISKLRLRDAIVPPGMNAPKKPVGTSIDPQASFGRPVGAAAAATAPASTPATQTPTVSIAGVGQGDVGQGTAPCTSRPVLDAQARPITGSDGMPLMVTCDGRSVPTRVTPTVSIAGVGPLSAASAAAGTPAIALPADRYGGGVMLENPAKAAGEMSAETKEALDVLKKLDTGQLGASQQTQAQGSGGLRLEGFGTSAPAAPRAPSAAASGPRGNLGEARETDRHVASMLDKRKWVALRGTQVECNLTLAYVSDVAGEAHCVIARDVYGQDGSTILVDRGAIANGSFRAVNGLGERRAQVIWDRLVTPQGVVVTLASKGTDALGSTGIPAVVDNRWVDRLGVALAISLVKDVSTAVATRYAQAASAPSQQVLASSQRFADEVLGQTIAIRPSLYVKQGSAASIVLQSDLDFSGVYALRR